MDFTPLQQLRERLKIGAIAGTKLLSEDFRLTRALEVFAPMEAASPVFGKIGQGVRGLLSPDCKDTGAALLDVLALVDAVLVTQSVTAVAEEMKPLILHGEGAAEVRNVPYSRLAQLIDSLTNSGGGRYSYVEETYQNSPELFEDYRVKQAMVKTLGGTYAELAEQAANWLSEGDASILPLLMHDFDPKGKREMVRRLNVIEAVAGAKANDFYLSLLEDSEKDVRAAAVYALHHSNENAERLIALAKTEKGNAKKQAHWALARLESPEVDAYWEQLVAKKPQDVAVYMQFSTTPHTSQMVAEGLLALIAPFETGQGVIDRDLPVKLSRLLESLPGKSGAAVCDFYQRAAALRDSLDKPLPEEKVPSSHSGLGAYSRETIRFSESIPMVLFDALILNPTADLLALAEKLGEQYGKKWKLPQLTAALLVNDGENAWKIGEKYLESAFGLLRNKEHREILEYTLGYVFWNEQQQNLVISRTFYDFRTERTLTAIQPLKAPLDLRWYQALAKDKGSSDNFLIKMVQPDDPEICGFLCEYFYKRGLEVQENMKYIRALKRMGYNRCTGLGLRYCEGRKVYNYWYIESLVQELPGNDEERAKELSDIIELATAGKILFGNGNAAADLNKLYEAQFGYLKLNNTKH